MLYVCVRRFDITGTVQKILGAKHNNGVGSESQMQHCMLVWVAAVDEIISGVADRKSITEPTTELTCILDNKQF